MPSLQVAPAELEGLLLKMDSVADCAVIGVPDEESGELPKAFVVKKQGHDHVAEKDVMQFVAGMIRSRFLSHFSEHVSHYKQLKGGVAFIDEIPKSPSGKILRRMLRDRVKAKL